MRYCKKCVMPDTRPGIHFDEEGVCQACRAEEQKQKTDYSVRWKELEKLCDKHRGKYGKNAYDCIIAISGGKDSHYQVHILKEKMGMNPLLVSVEDNFTMTEAGKSNIKNISETFGCDILSLKPNIKAQKILMRKCFEKWAKPTWFIDRLIYTYPIKIAINFKIPLVVYGENISYEYGGADRTETYSALNQINNGVATDIPYSELIGDGVTEKDLYLCNKPLVDIGNFEIEPIYLSYFVKWSSHHNYQFAKNVGFKDLKHEWLREHTPEYYDQVDSYAYLIHPWLKYPKFGHASATDYASKWIRYGLITREEGIELVKKYDAYVDAKSVDDFCSFLGYTRREFYDIVNKFYNMELFTKKHDWGGYELKKNVWDR